MLVFAELGMAQPPHPLNPPATPSTFHPNSYGPVKGPQNRVPPALNNTTWTAIGPASLSTGAGNVSGRVTGLAVDPTNANNIYSAAAGGGVWQSTDGGTTYNPLTDNQGTLAMGAIAVAPSNHLKIYAGTGEANNSGDSNYGLGILVSNDGGATWSLSTGPSGAFNRRAVAQISVDPTNANTAYTAVGGYDENGLSGNTGIYKTTDGGTTWTNMTAANGKDSTYPWSAVVVDPNTPTIVYAAHGEAFGNGTANGIYRSTDSGSTWSLLTGTNAPSGAGTGRYALAVGPSASTAGSHVLYVAISDPNTYGLNKFLVSSNADAGTAATPTFTDRTSTTPDFLGAANGSGQGWYDIVILVNPANAADVYAAGVVTYSSNTHAVIRSTTSGASWTDITTVGGVEPHTDNHAMAFDPSGKLLLGNDGGVWRYDPTGPSWTNLNGNLNTIQFTGIGLTGISTSPIGGGSQDNGTEKYTGTLVWSAIDGGDGGLTQISQTLATRWYHVAPPQSFGNCCFFRRSDDSGSTWMNKTGFTFNSANFYPPFTVDPSNGNHLFIGLDYVNESTTQGDSWTAVGTPGTAGFNPSDFNVDSVAFAPGTTTIYAAVGGEFAANSQIYVTTNHGTLWTQHNLPVGGRVNEIDVDPNDATGQTAYAAINTFNGASGQVYKTVNGGETWTNISGNLPAVPTWSLQVDTDANHTVYVSDETGVYSSISPYSTWTAYGTGLAHGQGVQLQLNRTLHVLALATHGRGVWEILTQSGGVTNVTSSTTNGTYGTGANISIQVTFNEVVTVTGTPKLQLNSAGSANYVSGSGTNTLTFTYTVAAGENNPHLDELSTRALILNGGTISEPTGDPAILTLPAPGAAGSLGANKNLVISTLSCVYSLPANSATFGSPGGSRTFSVTAGTGCLWTVSDYTGWVIITSGSPGSGNGAVGYTVAKNTSASPRVASLTIDGMSFTITQNGVVADKVGIFRSSVVMTAEDVDGDIAWSSPPDRAFLFGAAGDVVIKGDWDGSGLIRLGIYRPSAAMFALDMNNNGVWDPAPCGTPPCDRFGFFGQSGDTPLVGDWTGDGISKIGIFRPSTNLFALDINNDLAYESGIDKIGHFGSSGDVPILGDWTGDGITKVGIYRASASLFAEDINNNLAWDAGIDKAGVFGAPGDTPILGDWTGDGITKIGIFRSSVLLWGLDANNNLSWDPGIDKSGVFGATGDQWVVGDWDGSGVTRIGIFRPSNALWGLDKNGNLAWDPGIDLSGAFGAANDVPFVGKWQ